MKQVGYATAISGKWQINDLRQDKQIMLAKEAMVTGVLTDFTGLYPTINIPTNERKGSDFPQLYSYALAVGDLYR